MWAKVREEVRKTLPSDRSAEPAAMSVIRTECFLPPFAASFAVSEKSWKLDEQMKSACQAALPAASEMVCLLTVAYFLEPANDRRKFLMKLLLCWLN